VKSAHKQGIHDIIMTEQGVYTASQDRTLKRWKPTKLPDGRFQLNAEITIPLPDSCVSLLYFSQWLFCGLFDGSVRAFHQDGTEATLMGHTRRVTTIIAHQNVLITGSVDREVRLWQMDPASKKFSCTHTLTESMPGSIMKLHVLGEYLFVGGINGVAMVHLVKLEVTKLLPPTKPVADFLEFQGHLIVAYQEGALRVFDPAGECKSETKPLAAGPILSLAGLESGPRVLVGHTKGQVSIINLPGFDFKTQFQAIENTRVSRVMCAGHDGIFMLGFDDGTLQLWQRIGA
jgi:WD40 repeat protein